MSTPELDAGVTTDSSTVTESGIWIWVMRGLAATAVVVAGYLAWASLTASPVIGCGGGNVFDCSHVLTSRWSKVAGIPVGVPAFILYCVLLSALVFCRHPHVAQIRRICWNCVTFCGITAGLAAVWFTGLQFFTLEHLCPWCLAAHSCGLIICSLLLWKQPLGGYRTVQLSGLATLGVAVLVTGQLMTPAPQTWEVLRYDDVLQEGSTAGAKADDDSQLAADLVEEEFLAPGDDVFAAPVDDVFAAPPAATAAEAASDTIADDNSAAGDASATAAASLLLLMPPRLFGLLDLLAVSGTADDEPAGDTAGSDADTTASAEDSDGTEVQEPAAPERRLIGVTGNRFRLDVRQWPLLGKPDAKYVFVEMFDYTCPHCRNTHRAIKGAFERYGDDLAIIALAVPLDRKCNSSASSSGGAHRDSCEISRIAVGVWRIDAEKFHELHDWLFETKRTAASTRRKAEELVGKEALTKELNYPTAGQYIARHVDLYKRVGAGSVPKLMFPKSSMVGEVSSTRTLCNTIERELANQ